MNNSLRETVRELREMFPTLSDIELVQLALGQTQHTTKLGVTVSDLLVKVRKIFWITSLNVLGPSNSQMKQLLL